MPKFIDEVLSEILGVSCGDVKFQLHIETIGQSLGDNYCNGIQRATLEFKCKKRIESDKIGSIYLCAIVGVVVNEIQVEYYYSAVLVKGKETAMLAKAVYDGLS
jgi:hypothetical protein